MPSTKICGLCKYWERLCGPGQLPPCPKTNDAAVKLDWINSRCYGRCTNRGEVHSETFGCDQIVFSDKELKRAPYLSHHIIPESQDDIQAGIHN